MQNYKKEMTYSLEDYKEVVKVLVNINSNLAWYNYQQNKLQNMQYYDNYYNYVTMVSILTIIFTQVTDLYIHGHIIILYV